MPARYSSGKKLMDPSDDTLTGRRQGKGVFETLFDENISEYSGNSHEGAKLYATSEPKANVGDEKDSVTDIPPVSHTPYGDEHMKKEKDLKAIKDDPYENKIVEAFIDLLESA